MQERAPIGPIKDLDQIDPAMQHEITDSVIKLEMQEVLDGLDAGDPEFNKRLNERMRAIHEAKKLRNEIEERDEFDSKIEDTGRIGPRALQDIAEELFAAIPEED